MAAVETKRRDVLLAFAPSPTAFQGTENSLNLPGLLSSTILILNLVLHL